MQPREPGILTSNLPITGRSAPTTWATAAPATNHNKCCSERTRKVMADVFQHRKIRKKHSFPGLNNLLGRSNIDFWVYEVPLNAPWSPCQHDLLGWGSEDSQYSCQHDSFCTNISLLSKFDLGECSFWILIKTLISGFYQAISDHFPNPNPKHRFECESHVSKPALLLTEAKQLCSSNGMVYCVLQSLHLEPNPHTEFTSIHSSAPRRRLNVWHPSLRSPLALSSLLNYKWIQHRQFVELVLSVPRFRNSLVSCWQTLKHNVGEMKKIKWPALSGLNVPVLLFLPHFLHKKQTLI